MSDPEGSETEDASLEVAGEPPLVDRLRRRSVRLFAKLPRPARLLWISLLLLGVYAIAFTLQGQGIVPLIALPALAVETDLLFQMFRFHKIRAPDAAIATGLLLALLLPPTVPLLQAVGVASAAIALRHVLRFQDRPVFNPAAAGVLMGALFFGLAPSWWGSVGMWLVVVLGVVLTLRTPGSWRVPLAFFVSYGVLSVLANLILGEVTSPQVLLLGALDPAMLFFGFFMVPEPRTSVVRPTDRWIFGLAVGVATGILPAVLPSLAPLVALLVGNGIAVALRRSRAAEAPPVETKTRSPSRTPSKRERARRRHQRVVVETRSEWTTPRRVVSGALVVVLLGGMALAMNAPSTTHFTAVRPSLPVAVGNVTATNNCTTDNPSVPSDVASFLHQRLGPSVILSADTSSGTVVFYDPVNRATVTETNIYEDYGFAEFNGDDYAVMGCSG
ncbi:MAG TPA: RnfABCDGE type electron transport complex subunit D [Thermoplasmata archaeon]|nr:RnfABCDGE type electron transport complex subunit D [Thermoplasmata archaeon]